ncbi:MAG: YbhB/YbcL family Raf kinase inhibitor-like protein [Ilumatobacteraceae bacterium]
MRRLTVLTATCVALMLVAAGCNHDGRYLRPATPDQNATISTTVLATTVPASDIFEPGPVATGVTGAIDSDASTTIAPTSAEPNTTLVADDPTTTTVAAGATVAGAGATAAGGGKTTTIKTVDLGGTAATLPGSSAVPTGPGPNAQNAGNNTDGAGSPVAVLLSAIAPWRQGAPIDARYTCVGANLSPPLSWSAGPAGTVEIAITMSDDQARSFVHWAIAGLDPGATSIPEGGVLPGVVQGINGSGTPGYTGPCPPAGQTHTYELTIHFLGSQIELGDGAAGADMLLAINAATIARAVVTGTSGRN